MIRTIWQKREIDGNRKHCAKIEQQNSPSLPFGFSAAAAKHFGHDAFKSISLWCVIPFLNRIDGVLQLICSFEWLILEVPSAGMRKEYQMKNKNGKRKKKPNKEEEEEK